MALQDTNTADVVSFIDTQVAQCMGVATAAIIAAIFRTVSADWSARRIQAANWKELATLASSPRAHRDWRWPSALTTWSPRTR
ncbi:hypothetical protein G6F22_021661 [Rhizopus arrhizus]|nr:hypothetical protein G6F22_021661 [Rhizopus arrhizus]